MKKILFAIILFSVVFAASSCKKDSNGGSPDPVSPYAKNVTYSVINAAGGGATLPNNFAISYTGSDGTMVVVPIASIPWTKSVQIADTRTTKTCSLYASSATVSVTEQVGLSISTDLITNASSAAFTFTTVSHDANIAYSF